MEIAGGVVIKIGCPARAKLAAASKHAKADSFITKSSFSRTFCKWFGLLGSLKSGL